MTYMSTSLNVVSNAKVFWESFNRVATRFRSLVIGTFINKWRHQSNLNCSAIFRHNYYKKAQWLTRLSLSLGGSCGSVGECRGGEGALDFSAIGAASTLVAFVSCLIFWVGWGAGFSDTLSDGATWVVASADLEIIATLLPGSTVSPSLARSW